MAIAEDVVKSRMRDTVFFAGSMTWAAVKNHLLPPDHEEWDAIFGKNDDESSGAQRKLNRKRVQEAIVPYLLLAENPFFSSLTLVMVPMDGSPLKEGEHYTFAPCKEGSLLGELKVQDHVRFFTADGQHREAGIVEAVTKNPALAMERVPVIFLPFTSDVQVRQWFSDLNLNAKPVNKTIGYSYESRDPVVILVKRVIQEVPLFKGRVNELTNSLSRRSLHVITMNTLVAANTDLLLARYGAANADTLRKQPAIAQLARKPITSSEVGIEAQPLVAFWNAVIDNTPGWDRVMLDEDEVDQLKPGEVREGIYAGDGTLLAPGHVSGYGIGWQAIAKAMAALVRWKSAPKAQAEPPADPLAALVDCIKKVDWRRGKHWNGIAMVGSRVNNTGPGVRATAGYILEQGGFTEQTEEIAALNDGLRRSLEAMEHELSDFDEAEEEPVLA